MVKWWLCALALLLAFAAASACTLFDPAPPDDSCMSDDDCFKAQGEACNQMTHKCEVRPDGGVDAL